MVRLALLLAAALSAQAQTPLKRELCGVALGMSEEKLLKTGGRDVSADFAASLGKGDHMFSLPLVPRQRLQTRCLARTHGGKISFIEATWNPEYTKRYSWDDFLEPETRQYGLSAREDSPYAGWERESRVWKDGRTVMTMSRSAKDVTYYQVSIEVQEKP